MPHKAPVSFQPRNMCCHKGSCCVCAALRVLFNMAPLAWHWLRDQEYQVQISAPLVTADRPEMVHVIALDFEFFICETGILSIMRITWADACKVPDTEKASESWGNFYWSCSVGREEKSLVPGRGSGMRQGLSQRGFNSQDPGPQPTLQVQAKWFWTSKSWFQHP